VEPDVLTEGAPTQTEPQPTAAAAAAAVPTDAGPADTGPAEADADSTADDRPPATPLLAPREGVPTVVTTAAGLAELVDAIAGGTGPIAIDAERASGYRYSMRAYLVQLRRVGSGSWLIDPIECPDLSTLGAVIADVEWVLHAANQDLACLAELGLRPTKLFDTELAGRLLDHERVGLGPLIEETLGFALEKGHSAADWSRRPLPEPWLVYAALDVELLVELRDVLAAELVETGKDEWARQEFAHIIEVAAGPPTVREEPWRRTSGIHRTRDRRALAAIRALWSERDAVARRRDLSPSRLLTDQAIVEAATVPLVNPADLAQVGGFTGRNGGRADLRRWWDVLEHARALSEDSLPAATGKAGDGPPPPRVWDRQRPDAAARLKRCRAVVVALAAANSIPPENLISPDLVRRLAWAPPAPGVDHVENRLLQGGARPWQVGIVAGPLAQALPAPPPTAPSAVEPTAVSAAPEASDG
jgi:ribonuclease D